VTEWYYASGDVQQGPVSADALKAMISRGEVGPKDLVWREGMANWTPLAEVPELRDPGTTPAGGPPPPSASSRGAYPYEPPKTEPVVPRAGPYARVPEGSGKATASMVLGICGLVFFCFPCVGLILGILATVYGGQVLDAAKTRPELAPYAGRARAGQVMGIIAIVLGVLLMVLNGVVSGGADNAP
jgi:hypothetical protein